ncbi:MAG: glycosyltransferase family 4 protein [Saprospiraceae bacterium]|nr:glycosyltransferase family 4 protein [Saprospiraceae bacterium]
MKIAIIADPIDNQNAGVHSYTRQLVEALIQYDQEHEYILIREKHDPNLTGVTQLVVPNTRLPIGFASFRLFVLVPFLLWRHKVDVVFEPAHFGPFNLPRKIKRVTMIHDLTPLLFPQYHRWHSQVLQRIFLKGILRRTDLVLSNSQNTTRDLHEVFPFTKDKVATILLGRDPFYQPANSREFLEKKEIIDPYFLFVGTIEPRKDLKTLLAAYQLFREENTEKVLLILVGGLGWKSEDFAEKLEAHPYRADIIRPGYVEQQYLPELYTYSKALIYPSEYEGFGLPVLEALACGTNVICTDNSSLSEVGGELAYYFPTHDVSGLKKQMQFVFAGSEEVKRSREAGPKWAATFSWKEYVSSFLKAVEKL